MDIRETKRLVKSQIEPQLANPVDTPEALSSTPMLSSDDQKGPLSDYSTGELHQEQSKAETLDSISSAIIVTELESALNACESAEADAVNNINISTKKKKKKYHGKLKGEKTTGIRKRHVLLKEEDRELVHFPVASDVDHSNDDSDICANATILKQSDQQIDAQDMLNMLAGPLLDLITISRTINTDTLHAREECRERLKKSTEKLLEMEGKKKRRELVRDMIRKLTENIQNLVAWEKELDEEIESLGEIESPRRCRCNVVESQK